MEEGSLVNDWSPAGSLAEVIPETEESAGNGTPVRIKAEESFALREWTRQNAIRLEEKERMEKETLQEIIGKADEFKAEFYKKWSIRCENSKSANREKEKMFQENMQKFHGEADKSYWKTIADLIPKEVPNIETKGKKKKPSIEVTQGPKPGKPTDLSRMRQILVKLKHKPPGHMLPPTPEPAKDAKAH